MSLQEGHTDSAHPLSPFYLFPCTIAACHPQLRRGKAMAHITSINFSQDATLLCCASDRNTVHIFRLAPPPGEGEARSGLAQAKGLLPKYFNSQWSFAKFSVPSSQCICAFTPDGDAVLGKQLSSGRVTFTKRGEGGALLCLAVSVDA